MQEASDCGLPAFLFWIGKLDNAERPLQGDARVPLSVKTSDHNRIRFDFVIKRIRKLFEVCAPRVFDDLGVAFGMLCDLLNHLIDPIHKLVAKSLALAFIPLESIGQVGLSLYCETNGSQRRRGDSRTAFFTSAQGLAVFSSSSNVASRSRTICSSVFGSGRVGVAFMG
jgi:hypothetical protein